MKRTRRKCPGPWHDALYDLFVRRNMTIFEIQKKFGGRVTLTEIRADLAFVMTHRPSE